MLKGEAAEGDEAIGAAAEGVGEGGGDEEAAEALKKEASFRLLLFLLQRLMPLLLQLLLLLLLAAAAAGMAASMLVQEERAVEVEKMLETAASVLPLRLLFLGRPPLLLQPQLLHILLQLLVVLVQVGVGQGMQRWVMRLVDGALELVASLQLLLLLMLQIPSHQSLTLVLLLPLVLVVVLLRKQPGSPRVYRTRWNCSCG
eukprot:jgi/Mesen1/1975/ME000147S01066